MNNNLFKKEITVKQNIYVIFIYFSISDFTSYTQVNMRPFRGRDVQKWLRVAMLSPKDIVPSRRCPWEGRWRWMWRSLSLQRQPRWWIARSWRSWKLVESGLTKRMWEEMGYAEFGKVLSAVHYYRLWARWLHGKRRYDLLIKEVIEEIVVSLHKAAVPWDGSPSSPDWWPVDRTSLSLGGFIPCTQVFDNFDEAQSEKDNGAEHFVASHGTIRFTLHTVTTWSPFVHPWLLAEGGCSSLPSNAYAGEHAEEDPCSDDPGEMTFVFTRLDSSYSNWDQRGTAVCKGKKHSRKKMLKVIKGGSFDTVKDVINNSNEPEVIEDHNDPIQY